MTTLRRQKIILHLFPSMCPSTSRSLFSTPYIKNGENGKLTGRSAVIAERFRRKQVIVFHFFTILRSLGPKHASRDPPKASWCYPHRAIINSHVVPCVNVLTLLGWYLA